MRRSLIYVFAMIAAVAMVPGCGQDSITEADANAKDTVVTYEMNELYVEAGDFDVYFALHEPFDKTYLLFGGDLVSDEAAFNNFWLATISIDDARPIYEKYPDFYRCASPGAARAKEALKMMNIIVTDSDVLGALKEAVSEFNRRIGKGGDRVAVRLEGARLEMTAALVRGAGHDMLDQLPQEVRSNYFLIESAEVVSARTALEQS